MEHGLACAMRHSNSDSLHSGGVCVGTSQSTIPLLGGGSSSSSRADGGLSTAAAAAVATAALGAGAGAGAASPQWQRQRPRSLPLKSLNHVSVHCRDVEASLRFYRDLMGFIPVKRPSCLDYFDGAWLYNYGIGIHLLKGKDSQSSGGSAEASAESLPINPCSDHVSFQCDDIDAVEGLLAECGVPFVRQTVEECGVQVRQLFFHDPDSHMIEICNCDELPVVPLQGLPYPAFTLQAAPCKASPSPAAAAAVAAAAAAAAPAPRARAASGAASSICLWRASPGLPAASSAPGSAPAQEAPPAPASAPALGLPPTFTPDPTFGLLCALGRVLDESHGATADATAEGCRSSPALGMEGEGEGEEEGVGISGMASASISFCARHRCKQVEGVDVCKQPHPCHAQEHEHGSAPQCGIHEYGRVSCTELANAGAKAKAMEHSKILTSTGHEFSRCGATMALATSHSAPAACDIFPGESLISLKEVHLRLKHGPGLAGQHYTAVASSSPQRTSPSLEDSLNQPSDMPAPPVPAAASPGGAAGIGVHAGVEFKAPPSGGLVHPFHVKATSR